MSVWTADITICLTVEGDNHDAALAAAQEKIKFEYPDIHNLDYEIEMWEE